MHTIRQLTKQLGVTARTIRFYEDAKLLSPKHLPNGMREYSDSDVAELTTIVQWRRLGISIAQIRRYLALSTTDRAQLLSQFLHTRLDECHAARVDLGTQIDALRALLAADHLEEV